MALDPNIFFQGAALRQANDARTQQLIGSLFDRLTAQRMAEQDPEKQLRQAVFRISSGKGTPEDEQLIKAESLLRGSKTQYQPDALGNVRAVTEPTLYDRLYGTGTQTVSPQAMGIPESDISLPVPVGTAPPKSVMDAIPRLDVSMLEGEPGIDTKRIADAKVRNAAAVNAPAVPLSKTNAYVATTPTGQLEGFKTDEAIREAQAKASIEQSKKTAEAEPKAEASLADLSAKVENMNSTIDKAINDVGALSAGYVGQKTMGIGGTPAANLAAILDTIKADAAFSELQKMRENSPTGGALGSVSENELALLTNAQAALSQIQSPERLKEGLMKYKQLRQESLNRVKAAFRNQYGYDPNIGTKPTIDQIRAELQRRQGQ